MSLLETLALAFKALTANKLRSILTMLGIIIGVAAVVALMSIGRGVEQFVAAEFQSVGSNLIILLPGGRQEQTGPPGSNTGRVRPLTNADVLALAQTDRLPSVVNVTGTLFEFAQVEAGRERLSGVQTLGVSPNYNQLVESYTIAEGRFFNETDERSAARVVILGQTAVRRLFPSGEPPIGQNVKINNLPFRVVGVLNSIGGGAFGDQDRVVLIPLATAQQRVFNARTNTGGYAVSLIYLKAANSQASESAVQEIADFMRERRNIAFRGEDDFTVVTQDEVAGAFGQVTSVLTTFLGLIAGISLLVGGIGIMNIMLVSVTERTKEIGLRKALGAKKRDVLTQFLVEAITVSLLGGLLGVALGAGAALLVSAIQPDIPVAVTFDSIALGTGVSAAIGLFFGLYPASRASNLSPIEALRYE